MFSERLVVYEHEVHDNRNRDAEATLSTLAVASLTFPISFPEFLALFNPPRVSFPDYTSLRYSFCLPLFLFFLQNSKLLI